MLTKIRKKIAESGWLGLCLAILTRLRVFKYLRIYYFYRVPLDQLHGEVGCPEGISTQVITIDQSKNIDALNQVLEKDGIYRRRLDAGLFAVLAYAESVPVGFVWGDLRRTHLEERFGYEIELAPDDVYSFDNFVAPDRRRMGVWKALLTGFIDYVSRVTNRKSIAVIVELTNRRSIFAHERLGYRKESLHVAGRLFSGNGFHWRIRQYKRITANPT
jgi:GNAT superfamily N-acetyltransferase